jgi:hypothetical protein
MQCKNEKVRLMKMKRIAILLALLLLVSFNVVCYADEVESAENKPSDELLIEFIEATKQIENDEQYEPFLKMCASATSKKTYLEFNPDKSEEDWDSMTLYEQAITYLLDTLPKQSMLGQNTNKHMVSREAFLERIDVFERYLNNVEGGSEVYKAIERVWDWHYNTWTTKRQFVSPFGGELITKDTLNQDKESNKGDEVKVLQNATTNTSEMDKEQQELYNAVTENMTAHEKTELDKDMGNLSKVKSILIDNIASIGILLITVISFAIFHFKRKSMNVDTEEK